MKVITYLLAHVLSLCYLFEGKLIPDSSLGLNELAYHDEPSQIYLGSPSIIRLSSGRLVASHDLFGNGYTYKPRNVTVYTSDDNGETWILTSYIKHSYWTTLSVYKDMIYAIGIDLDSNLSVIIHRSSDNGQSWIYNGTDDGVILFPGPFATGATPIVIANQVMYRAIEAWPAPAPSQWPVDFQAAIISCDLSKSNGMTVDDLIMSPSNWRLTPPLPFNQDWTPKSFPYMRNLGYLEGNVVVQQSSASSKELRVFNIFRFNAVALPHLAIILELNQTTNTLSFVSIIKFPGGMSKFSIRYDPVTQTHDYGQRNILSLSYSKDLVNWTIGIDHLLYDDTDLEFNDSLRYTGFHYVDWQFDQVSSNQSSCIEWNCNGGSDIIYLIRTPYRGAP